MTFMAFWLLLAVSGASAAATPASPPPPAGDAVVMPAARQALSAAFDDPAEWDEAQTRARLAAFEAWLQGGQATRSDWFLAAHVALRHWRFDQVAAWQQSAAGREPLAGLVLPSALQPLPPGSAPGWWALRESDRALVEAPATARAPTELWVVFAPGCGFCRRMLEDVRASAELTTLMNRCGRWVGVLDGNFDTADYLQWAQRTGQAPVQFRRHWAPLGLNPPRATPVMHVVREGRVLQTVTGWPREGRAAELLAAVRGADVEGLCRAP
jgi:hypothetical protein